jgi:C4-dicarboxylate-specific signal transduction histidine kinase
MMRIQQLIVYLVTNAVQALADHEANIRMISIR